MDKCRQIILLLIMVNAANGSFTQTYLGKRFNASVGTSFNLPMRLNDNIQGSRNRVIEIATFPPEIEVNTSVALNSRLSIGLRSSFRGVSDTYIDFEGTLEEEAFLEYRVHDFLLRTNVFELGVELKYFSEYAPIGKYLSIGGMYSIGRGVVYPTLTHTRSNVSFNDVEEPHTQIIKLEPWSVNRNFFGISLGTGVVQQITKVFVLDYGVKANLYLGKIQFNLNYDVTLDDPNYDYENNLSDVMEYMMLGALRSSYLIEFYLQFGILL